MVNPQHAQRLAIWLAATHPALFRALAQQAAVGRQVARAPFSGFRGFGQSALGPGDLAPIDVTPMDNLPIDVTTMTPLDPSMFLDPTAIDTAAFSTPDIAPSPDSGGFFDSLSSGLSSVGSGIGSAIGGVTSYLTSSQGLNTLASLGTAYFKSQTPQAAVLNAQVARVGAGQSPAPITYTRNAQGQLVPVYYGQNSPGGYMTAQPVTRSLLSQLTPSGLFAGATGLLLVGGLLVGAFLLLKR